MAPKNNMMARMEAKYDAKYKALFHAKMDMIRQMGQDAGMIAANEVFHMGPTRAPDFCVAYREAMNAMARLVVEDSKSDKDIWYAKAKIDEQIKAIVGEKNFAPWEEQYGEVSGNA